MASPLVSTSGVLVEGLRILETLLSTVLARRPTIRELYLLSLEMTGSVKQVPFPAGNVMSSIETTPFGMELVVEVLRVLALPSTTPRGSAKTFHHQLKKTLN